ncbi:aminoacetone oxidase family FAD-binding enzyme [Chlorobaculum sp. 24CR]|uniref:NAD(P)/FAD-dependent oxidoreductase n=1 Tax=Chlorobaculum sp. 24CR TaxID=2508878 RepID=UPI00100ADF01|nr:aminoacetone oxidase family FAD-binding enzyme [Chlorobaculum sp. 24CR]RXK87978.1 aminoacetone oxidase family FAD-binding enzyme [Chlorobaculum sp. 24CR]
MTAARNLPTLLIAGAGASGLLAAISARKTARELGVADERLRIVLLERNPKPGNKIAISGGGHCNLTHDADVKSLLEKGFLDKSEQRFLRHAIHSFSNADLLELFGRYGLKTEAREDGRVFPVSGRAGEVLDLLRRMVEESAATLVTNARADRLECAASRFAVHAGERQFEADAVILATGGASWGSAGTTGDGNRLAAAVGHSIAPVMPALAPNYFIAPPKAELVGITLRNILLLASADGAADSRRGDVLISHRGISGPACLSLSRSVAGFLAAGKTVTISVDLLPGREADTLSAFILEEAARHGTRQVRTFLQRCPLAPERLDAFANSSSETPTIPNAFADEILRQAGISKEVTLSGLTKAQRRGLVSALKHLALGTVKKVPLDRAEVSAGGIELGEIDPKTMQSKIHPRLYCCGELLNYAGEVGGFNLQAAFSTGWLAGSQAARTLLDNARQPAQE